MCFGKKDFRLSIKRKQSCQVKRKEEFLMPLKNLLFQKTNSICKTYDMMLKDFLKNLS